MKKKIILLAILGITFGSCSYSSEQNKVQTIPTQTVDTTTTTTKVENEDTVYLAYDIFKLLNPDSPSPKNSKVEDRYYYCYEYKDEEDYVFNEIVICYQDTAGNYVVVYEKDKTLCEGDGCDWEILDFKTFMYKKGRLTKSINVLPKITFDKFNKTEALWYYNRDNAESTFESDLKIWVRKDKKLRAFVSDETYNIIEFLYNWNGVCFSVCDSKSQLGFIKKDGLGPIRLGDFLPGDLAGITVNKKNNIANYKRNGKNLFSLETDSLGKIVTITVKTSDYMYPYWNAGAYEYLWVGRDYLDSEDLQNLIGIDSISGDSYFIKNEMSIIEFYAPEGVVEYIKIQGNNNFSDEDKDDEDE
ncbi:MAG: hypothetical protein IKQ46_13750 [Bacteroidales bacterium]|nr:hypothetical protein [Bacteroidales bacterium]